MAYCPGMSVPVWGARYDWSDVIARLLRTVWCLESWTGRLLLELYACGEVCGLSVTEAPTSAREGESARGRAARRVRLLYSFSQMAYER